MEALFGIINSIAEINSGSTTACIIGLLLLLNGRLLDRKGYLYNAIGVGEGVSKKKDPVLFKKKIFQFYKAGGFLIILSVVLYIIFH